MTIPSKITKPSPPPPPMTAEQAAAYRIHSAKKRAAYEETMANIAAYKARWRWLGL